MVCEVLDAIVLFFLFIEASVGAVLALEDDGGALVLVEEELFISEYFIAPFVFVAAVELEFAEEVAGDSVDLVELGFVPAEGARIWVF